MIPCVQLMVVIDMGIQEHMACHVTTGSGIWQITMGNEKKIHNFPWKCPVFRTFHCRKSIISMKKKTTIYHHNQDREIGLHTTETDTSSGRLLHGFERPTTESRSSMQEKCRPDDKIRNFKLENLHVFRWLHRRRRRLNFKNFRFKRGNDDIIYSTELRI